MTVDDSSSDDSSDQDDSSGQDDRRVVLMPRNGKKSARCPICDDVAVHRFRPFCSKRCADIDLGRWFKGGYSIPTEEAPEVGEMPPEPSQPDET